MCVGDGLQLLGEFVFQRHEIHSHQSKDLLSLVRLDHQPVEFFVAQFFRSGLNSD